MTTPRIPPNATISNIAAQRGLTPASVSARDLLRKQAVTESLNVPNPASATTGMALDYDAEGSRIDLPVMDIAFYDENPRTNINPLYGEIKESIRESGIRSPLVVTRKPNTKQYFLAAGGNTRLLSIRELWEETQDPRFYKTTCTFTAWKSDSDVLAGHLIENEVRGNMSFWDKAQGRWSLKTKLEAQQGATLGLRKFETALKEIGLATQLSVLSNYFFAVERLKTIGNRLSKENVKLIQPRYNLYKKLAALHGIDEAMFQRECFEPSQLAFLETAPAASKQPFNPPPSDAGDDGEGLFDTNAFLIMAEQAVLDYLKLSDADGAVMLRKIQEFPDITLGELKQVIHANQRNTSEPPIAAVIAAGLQAAGAPDPALLAAQHAAQANDDDTSDFAGTPPSTVSTDGGTPPPVILPPVAPKPPPSLELRIDKAKKELMVAVRELVGAAKLYDDFYEYKGAKYGFFVEFPKAPLDSHDNAVDRCTAWWLIASLSGQQDYDTVSLLPDTSAWRHSFLGLPPADGAETLDHETRVQHDLGAMGSYMPVAWLATSHRPVVSIALRCLNLHQQAQVLLSEQAEQVTQLSSAQTPSANAEGEV